MMAEQEVQYKSFLLRLWREGETANKPWRATVECVTEERERCHFADIDGLFLFLLAEMSEEPYSSGRNR